MVKNRPLLAVVTMIFIAALSLPAFQVSAQGEETPKRPLIVIESYYLDADTVAPGQSFKLFLSILNKGGEAAYNVTFKFTGEDFLPQETGGVVALGNELGSGASTNQVVQRFVAQPSLWGRTNGTINVQLTYNGADNTAYTESFVITVAVLGWSAVVRTPTPTPTTTAMPRAQLGITAYRTNIDPLQPGSIFTLDMDLRNLGNGEARGVSMIIGGGTAGGSGSDGTPQPGGVSGSGADLSVFAPLESSNVHFLGDIGVGANVRTEQKLIVNVSANPGAYTLKVSFVYLDAKGGRQVDDQAITLLVYQLPLLEVNYYRDPGPVMAMQPNTLPIQVVNLGRKSAIMGNMTITAENAELSNNTMLIGTLEPGGYFPMDVTVIPQAPGPLELTITINYTDDFNQPRKVVQTMQVQVTEGFSGGEGMPGGEGVIGTPGMEGPGMVPGEGPGGMPGIDQPVQETFWQKVLRFLKGLVGLDSAPPQNEPLPGEMPPGEMPPGEPLPVNPGGKG